MLVVMQLLYRVSVLEQNQLLADGCTWRDWKSECYMFAI